ncbi:MAG: DUF255 domain-containing protein [Flavobacteriales bacterium]|nr:DUF255 domain-containing protein [Flavobacteriales bacterium]
MRTSLLLIITLFATTLTAQNKGINWLTWDQMTEANKQAPKKIFIDAYTSWCGWCKRMDQTTFQDPSIVAIMNKYFYPVKMNAEMGEPIDFNGHTFVNPNPGKTRSTHQFAASILDYQLSYPSYVILDENLQRVVIYKGYLQVEDLLGIILYFGKNQHLNYQKQLKKQFQQQPATQQK